LLVKKTGAAGASVALGTLAFEKILDGLTLVLVLLFAVVLLGPPGCVMVTALLPGAIFAGALVFLVALRVQSSWVLFHATRFLKRCPTRYLRERGVGLLSRFIDGLGVIESRWQILAAVALTAVVWLGEFTITCWLTYSMGIPLSLSAAAVVCAMIGLGYMVPAAPAAVGSYEAAAVAGFGLFNVYGERALAAALVLHGCSLALTTGLGLVGMVLSAGNAPGSATGRAFGARWRSSLTGRAHSPGDGTDEHSEQPAALEQIAPASDMKNTATCQTSASSNSATRDAAAIGNDD
jgi:uncharacterized protein (TIRG00374 family)